MATLSEEMLSCDIVDGHNGITSAIAFVSSVMLLCIGRIYIKTNPVTWEGYN